MLIDFAASGKLFKVFNKVEKQITSNQQKVNSTNIDFLDYSGNEPWVESSFDQGMTIKYNYQFEI